MDVVMPETDGLELLPQFRTDYPGIPVIVVSGRASFLTGVQAMRQGAVDFLRKPLNFEELVQSVTVGHPAQPGGRGAAVAPGPARPAPGERAGTRQHDPLGHAGRVPEGQRRPSSSG